MATFTDTDRAFLRRIREVPDDDTPRLVFADHLEETGREHRAEYIRIQCELYRLPQLSAGHVVDDGTCACRRCKLVHREWELAGPTFELSSMDVGGDEAAIQLLRLDCRFEYERGFIARVSCPTDVWVGGWCSQCRGAGQVFRPAAAPPRGPRIVQIDCSDCKGEGWLPAMGPVIVHLPAVLLAPAGVEFPDRNSGPGPNRDDVWWSRGCDGVPGTVNNWPRIVAVPWQLPIELFDALEGFEVDLRQDDVNRAYPDTITADRALGRAAIKWALGVKP